MKDLFLLLIIFFCSHFANAQGVCFGCGATYEFHDASVPPEYHRSYTIDVSGNEARLIIYSYSDTLLNESYPVDDIKEFLIKLKNCKISGKQIKNTNGCDGGTFESFFSDADFNHSSANYRMIHLKINAEVYHCGGKDYGGLKGNATDAVALFKSMIPGFDAKLASTLK